MLNRLRYWLDVLGIPVGGIVLCVGLGLLLGRDFPVVANHAGKIALAGLVLLLVSAYIIRGSEKG